GIERIDGMVIIQITQQGRDAQQKQRIYAALAERLAAADLVRPQDLIISVVENRLEDWSCGMGRAQFLKGELRPNPWLGQTEARARTGPPPPGAARTSSLASGRHDHSLSRQISEPVGALVHQEGRIAEQHAAPDPGSDTGGMETMATDLDIITFGRSGVDIYPLEIEKGLEDIYSFGKFLGGSPMNVAVAAARLGHRPGVITGVGDDPLGRYVVKEME